jgi:hypothetical protein
LDAKVETTASGAVDVVPVDGLLNFLAYCRLPRQIYKGRSGFAPPLDAERWTLHAARLNPHFKEVDWQAFIARKNGKPVGRILAQIYKPEFPTPVGASKAQFGALDAIDDPAVVAALTQAAEKWLRDRGAETIYGPLTPSIWGEAGLLVEGFEAAPMVSMPWNPPYLSAALEKLGYVKARDLISYRYDATPKDREAKPGIVERPEWRDRLKIRMLDLKKLGDEAAIIIDIFNDAWSENWGFVPLAHEEFMAAADGLKLIMPPEGGFIIELDGAPQAFGIVLPNLHEITADLDGRLFPLGLPRLVSRIRNHKFKSARLLLFGIRRALQRKAAGGAVILAFIEEVRKRSRNTSITHVEFGWVLEENIGMRRPIELSGAKIDKIHRVYQKNLAA